MHHCSLIAGRRSWKVGKLWDRFVPYFFHFLGSSPHNWRTTIDWNVVLPILHKPYVLIMENVRKYISMYHCPPIRGKYTVERKKGEKILNCIKISRTQDLRVLHITSHASHYTTIRLYNLRGVYVWVLKLAWGESATNVAPRLVPSYSRLYQEQTRLFPPLLLLLHFSKLPGSVQFTLGPKDRASRSHPQHALAPSPTLPYCRRPAPAPCRHHSIYTSRRQRGTEKLQA